jgi:hypothetical protein
MPTVTGSHSNNGKYSRTGGASIANSCAAEQLWRPLRQNWDASAKAALVLSSFGPPQGCWLVGWFSSAMIALGTAACYTLCGRTAHTEDVRTAVHAAAETASGSKKKADEQLRMMPQAAPLMVAPCLATDPAAAVELQWEQQGVGSAVSPVTAASAPPRCCCSLLPRRPTHHGRTASSPPCTRLPPPRRRKGSRRNNGKGSPAAHASTSTASWRWGPAEVACKASCAAA